MLTMRELVEDPVYRKYLQQIPHLPAHSRDRKRSQMSPPWVVYIQKTTDGKWGKKEFWKYSEAFKFLAKALKLGVHDAALNCKRQGFDPPERFVRIKGRFIEGSDGVLRQATKKVDWKPKLPGDEEDHLWCRYCRRPTIFRTYSKHRRLGACDPTVSRCNICGASERIALSATRSRKI